MRDRGGQNSLSTVDAHRSATEHPLDQLLDQFRLVLFAYCTTVSGTDPMDPIGVPAYTNFSGFSPALDASESGAELDGPELGSEVGDSEPTAALGDPDVVGEDVIGVLVTADDGTPSAPPELLPQPASTMARPVMSIPNCTA